MPLVWKRLRYAPLDWQTHPIDTAPDQPQGWGPFDGPYSPRDYLSPATQMGMSGINIGYTADRYLIDHAPGYHDITVFPDRSTASVNNVLVNAENNATRAVGSVYSSTISNTITRAQETGGGSGASIADLMTRLRGAVANPIGG